MKNRIDRVNELIKKKIAEIIFKEILIQNALITVQSVDTSKDLKYTRIKVSVFPFKYSEEALKILKKQSPNLQKVLNRAIKIKFVPRIRFILDRTEERAGRIERILRNLKN
ncbi:30S ribosome-binding factor RbfA [Patescibacteria group bacterium]|nr:30S ribosome-binding factor RbfA [Patescibacteria group bacterium]MBU4458646.1 30S ribosome-binding factor RbfA [Patescibacteria group bacterium]MCG2696005.1 30S ribosome-binding factor RbfA [Candidatus Portnoybacteria bacterium]